MGSTGNTTARACWRVLPPAVELLERDAFAARQRDGKRRGELVAVTAAGDDLVFAVAVHAQVALAIDERELARRPWVHQRQYVQIDRILAELVPRYFLHRKLESEYATLFLEEKGAGAD